MPRQARRARRRSRSRRRRPRAGSSRGRRATSAEAPGQISPLGWSELTVDGRGNAYVNTVDFDFADFNDVLTSGKAPDKIALVTRQSLDCCRESTYVLKDQVLYVELTRSAEGRILFFSLRGG